MTRDYRAENERNGIVYCGCVNCKAPVAQKEDSMKLPPEVKRAMERVELDTKGWENTPQSIPDLLEELRRFERDPGDWLRRILAERRAETMEHIMLTGMSPERRQEYLTGAWPSTDAVGTEGGKATTEELRR